MRLKSWNTNPTRRRRNFVSAASPVIVISAPSMNTRPAVGRSSPAAHCSRVLLPDPDGPITAVNEPRANVALTPSRAVTALPVSS
jgi:hypothetical protein